MAVMTASRRYLHQKPVAHPSCLYATDCRRPLCMDNLRKTEKSSSILVYWYPELQFEILLTSIILDRTEEDNPASRVRAGDLPW